MARFKSFRGLDSTRVGYLRAFLREANTAGVEVVVFIPPVHPSLERAEAASRALERTVETVALLRGLERDGLLRYVETRAISHSADSTAYVDVLHFLSPVAIRVAEAIAGGEGSCALQ
jgi:hypothetical protein